MGFVKKSIGQMLEEISRKFPDRDALIHAETGSRYSYSLLCWEVDRVAGGFVKIGISKGDRVALWATNISEWIISQVALAKIGAIMIPIDPGAQQEDLEFMLKQSECRAIVMMRGMDSDEYLNTLLAIKGNLPRLEYVILISDQSYPETILWSELTALGEEAGPEVVTSAEGRVKPEDPVAIMYTSGTTGTPKGVVLDHLGLVNKSMFSTERQGITHEDRLCLFFPLFHMFGNTCIVLAGLFRGAALILPCRSFDPPKVLKSIHKEKCTAVYGSPSMLTALVENPEFRKKNWKSVEKGIVGGAPCPMKLMKLLAEDIGVKALTVGYGITETSSWITMTSPADPIKIRVSTIGSALECNEIKIIDPVSGEDLPPSIPGELCTRGFLMIEYYKMPGATTAAIDRDGWFHTGDIGEIDEKGYVKLTGRLKEVIVRNGIEIHPAEVEEVLYRLPDVLEAQVFGYPHPEMGQEIAAWIKIKEGSSLSIRDLADHSKEFIAKDKIPSHFKIVEDFPMTRSGKVQKFKMAEMAEKEYSHP
ncbi:AMP-binding protein [Thermodesulfobacteriota bacterium]